MRYVLTAAHCVTQLPRGYALSTVRVGEHDLESQVDCKGMHQQQISSQSQRSENVDRR